MSKASAKKICIVVMSLGGGGAERSSALLSSLLGELGHEIFIVSVIDNIEYNFNGELLNLGKLKSEDDSVFGRFRRLRVLKKYLDKHQFDYVIDNRTRFGFIKELIISKWLYNSEKTIYCVHSYKVTSYVNKNRLLGRLLYNKAHKILAVSQAIADKLALVYGFKNVKVIHNAFFFSELEATSPRKKDERYILFYGRLEDHIKNVSLLLGAYVKSNLPNNKIKLIIMGDGKDKDVLKQTSNDLGLSPYVQFLDYRSNPYHKVKNALFTVLTSRYEGFPMVLVESLALGTPVVSVDCKSGPNEIVVHKHNGLLIENHNTEALAAAMNTMLEDKELYLHCKSNAKASVTQFSKNAIGQKWQQILE